MFTRIPVFLFTFSLFHDSIQLVPMTENDIKNDKVENLYSITCTTDRDCTLNSYCYYTRCTCKSGYIPDKDTRRGPVKCIKEASSIEDYCEKDIQCQALLGTHSFCNNSDKKNLVGKCICTNDAHYIDGRCYKTAYIGQSCEVNDNCLIKSTNIQTYCDFGHCICPPHYHPIDSGRDCTPTSELNGPCTSSDNCITMNAECNNGFCKCSSDFISDYDDKSCLFVPQKTGDPCYEDKQCLVNINKSRCDQAQEQCVCLEGHHEVQGSCWPSARLFDKCEHTNDCRYDEHHRKGVICKDMICQCADGYLIEKREFCIRYANATETMRDGNSASIIQISVLLFIGATVTIIL